MHIVHRNTSSFRIALALLLPLTLAYSCATREDVDNLQEQIDQITGTQIKSVEQQIASIKVSITDMEKVDAGLKTYIEELTATCEALQKAINDNDTKIDEAKAEFERALADAKATAEADQSLFLFRFY